MKYKVGNIVLLHDGRTVYIFQIDKAAKEYHVSDCDNADDCFTVKDGDIYVLVVSAL